MKSQKVSNCAKVCRSLNKIQGKYNINDLLCIYFASKAHQLPIQCKQKYNTEMFMKFVLPTVHDICLIWFYKCMFLLQTIEITIITAVYVLENPFLVDYTYT